MINKIICNRYKILDHLGTGGMATVWLGYDTILDRQVAIKTFKIDANDEDAVKRFNREAKAVTSLSHPNIVSIYDVENEGEFYYLILEYVKGMTLKDYMIKNPRIPIETIVHIAKQIASGLSHAHQNGIIHRDIKPQNILKNVPQSVKNIVLKATMKNPNERYISSKELFEDLSTVLNPERLYENKYTGFKIPAQPANNYNETQYIDNSSNNNQYDYADYNNEDDEYYYDYNQDNRNNNGRYQQNNKPKNNYNNVSKRDEKEETSKAKHIFLAIVAIITIVVGTFFIYNYVIGSNSVSAPDVRNKTLEEAKVVIVKAGLEVGDVTEVASDDVKEKTVIDSDPKAGKKVKKGSKVDLRVSSGKKTVDMPNFVGMDEETVKKNASKLGFKNITVEKVESNSYDTGKVISQNIRAGMEIIPKEKELIIQVSTGKKKVTMPNLVGEDSTTVESTVASYGFKNVTYREEYSDKEEGIVISQSIKTGSNIVPSDESLEIVISKGKERSSSRDESSDDSSVGSRSNDERTNRKNSTRNNSNNSRNNNSN